MKRPPTDEQKSLWKATVAAEGITTGPGEATGLSFIDAGLALVGVNSFVSMMAVIHPGESSVDSKDITAFTNATGEVTVAPAFKGGQVLAGVPYKIVTFRFVPAEVAAIAAALGNPTGDMGDVTQSEAASLAAYITRFKEHYRAHVQTGICLIVPDLANIVSDLQNTAILAELEKLGSVSVLDQTGVDDGQEDWAVYDLVVVGSNIYDAFVNANIDDLITLKIPIMVCNDDVAAHLEMGTAGVAQSASDVNEYCETIHNRVMYLVFGATGEQILFDSAQVSDRLDMSDANLIEEFLMVNANLDTSAFTVLGWLPMEQTDGTINKLEDGTEIPAGRLFAGCFLHADKLTPLGQLLLRRLARNLTQASITPSITLKAQASLVAAIRNDTNELQTDWTNGGRLDLILDDILLDTETTIPALLATIAGYIDTEVGAIETKLDTPANFMADVSGITAAGPTKAEMDTGHGLLATLAKQDIIDGIVDNILLDTQIRVIQSGVQAILADATEWLRIDSETNGAEILSIAIKGLIGHDWTLAVYVPAEDAVNAPAADDRRDAIAYVATDAEGGLLKPFGIPFNCYLQFTNNGVDDQIDQVTITYRSKGVLTLTWGP